MYESFLFSVGFSFLTMPPTRRTSLGRRTRNTASQRNIRANQTDEQREARNELERNRYQNRNVVFNPHRAAFSYNVAIDYSSEQIVAIGLMNIVCPHCKALKFKNEAPGLCCASGQVKDAIGTATRATTFIGFLSFFDSYPAVQ